MTFRAELTKLIKRAKAKWESAKENSEVSEGSQLNVTLSGISEDPSHKPKILLHSSLHKKYFGVGGKRPTLQAIRREFNALDAQFVADIKVHTHDLHSLNRPIRILECIMSHYFNN